jgi:hypothetical protein
MGRIRNTFGRFRRWIEAKSSLGKLLIALVAILGYILLTPVAEMITETSNNVVVTVVGLPVLILMVGCLYALAVVAWSLVTGARARLGSTG